MIEPGIIEPVSGDHPRSLGQGGNVLCRRLKPARHRGVVPGGNLARLTRHRRVSRGFDPCRRRREQAPHQFPMIVVHIAPRRISARNASFAAEVQGIGVRVWIGGGG